MGRKRKGPGDRLATKRKTGPAGGRNYVADLRPMGPQRTLVSCLGPAPYLPQVGVFSFACTVFCRECKDATMPYFHLTGATLFPAEAERGSTLPAFVLTKSLAEGEISTEFLGHSRYYWYYLVYSVPYYSPRYRTTHQLPPRGRFLLRGLRLVSSMSRWRAMAGEPHQR